MSLVEFRRLTQIDDLDEQQESLHCLRQLLTKMMLDPSKGLQELARVAKSSSTRAYAGHNAEFRQIFDIRNLNLTEYARSFGIYKVVHEQIKRGGPPLNNEKSKPAKLEDRPLEEGQA